MNKKARPGAGGAARHAHGQCIRRVAQSAPAARGPRAVRHRPARSRARSDRQSRRPRSDAAARRYSVVGEALGRIGRADRADVWRPLQGFRAALRRRAAGHICAPKSAMRCRATLSGSPASAKNTRRRWRQTPDAKVFEVVSAPLGSSGDQFGVIAKAATSIDTLDGFLRDMKARYPESSAAAAAVPAPAVCGAAVSAAGADAGGVRRSAPRRAGCRRAPPHRSRSARNSAAEYGRPRHREENCRAPPDRHAGQP